MCHDVHHICAITKHRVQRNLLLLCSKNIGVFFFAMAGANPERVGWQNGGLKMTNGQEMIDATVAAMIPCGKDRYRKDEILPELIALEKETANLVLGNRGENANVRIWDVENRLVDMNKDLGNVADLELNTFMIDCKELSQAISCEMSGLTGEKKVFRSLSTLTVPNCVMKNVQLSHGEIKGEIDALVVTPSACFVVEVKNTRKDVFIDEAGDYYRDGAYMVFDSNLGMKTREREYLVRAALDDAEIRGLAIESVVVFTNYGNTVVNECKTLQTCTLGQLPRLIEERVLRDVGDMRVIARATAAIEKAARVEEYPLEFDAARFKRDLATLLAVLKDGRRIEESEQCDDLQGKTSASMPIDCQAANERGVPIRRGVAASVSGILRALADAIGRYAA